jgi:MFS family permease
VLPFFGGALVDKFGARICLVAFTLFLVLGQVRASPVFDSLYAPRRVYTKPLTILFPMQLVFALGSVYRSIPVMLLGRTLYGLGGENLSVGQSALIAEWFMVRHFLMNYRYASTLY